MLRIMLVVKEISAYLLARSGNLTMLWLMAWADKLPQHVNQIRRPRSKAPKGQLLATIVEEDEDSSEDTADKPCTCAHIDDPQPNTITPALCSEYVKMLNAEVLDVRITAAA